jgi:Zn-dependent peptidase ImmA (M78 family)
MERSAIEAKAQDVLGTMWRARRKLWPLSMPPPIAMLDPEKIAEALGIECEFHDTLGTFGYRGVRFETAGMIDRGRERPMIGISTRFPREVQRFTLAHEVGHYTLHDGEVMHRDRPVDGVGCGVRSPVDEEADYFAACLLVPEALVTRAFEERFTKDIPLPLTDAVAYELGRGGGQALLLAGASSHDFARAVARATQFNGRRFRSLADTFSVSVSVMAIRIRELGLIEN